MRVADLAKYLWGSLAPRPRSLGQRGEVAAARLLRRKGYTIVAGGRRTRFGEIDLIAVQDRQTVVFVEVKTRRNLRGGHPAEAVDAEKQRRISNSALAYLKSHGLLEYPARFDVIAILWPKDASGPSAVEHIENAFEPPGQGRFFG
jgi:putative endonuclease